APLPELAVLSASVLPTRVALDADDLSLHLTRRDPRLVLDDRGVAVGLRHEADLVRLLLARDRETAHLRDIAHLRLGQLAEREERFRELRLRQLEEEVGLILREIARLPQLVTVAILHDPRVVAG